MLSLFSCSETAHGVAEGDLKPSIVTDHKLHFREAQSALNLRADGLSASHLVKALLVNQLRDQSVHPRKDKSQSPWEVNLLVTLSGH